MTDSFDYRKIYKKEIEPLVKKIREICKNYHMPMFTAFCVANDEKKTEYEYEIILAMAQKKLTDNRINSMLFSVHGFDINTPDEVKHAIRVLEDYSRRYQGMEIAGKELKDDKIDGFFEISNGSDISLPKGIVNKKDDDDDFEGLF